jgi:glucosamine--fructose-6-phosphate aminotransferase (isomerizing)
MCGIVGYIGQDNPIPILVDSLQTLEYRGYDSSGIAFLDNTQSMHVYKSAGKLTNLQQLLTSMNGTVSNAFSDNLESQSKNMRLGIGHIRWATHGQANDINAHPHMGQDRQVAVVHNGIIENFHTIREQLKESGRVFASETDTECVVQLLEQRCKEQQVETLSQFRQTFLSVLAELEGAFALAVIHQKFPNHLFAARCHAPLVVGVMPSVSSEDGENAPQSFMVASDSVALVPHTQSVVYLNDYEVAELSADGIQVTNFNGETKPVRVEVLDNSPLQIDKKGYKHFMLKEIFEQPDVIRHSLGGRLQGVDQPVSMIAEDEKKASFVEMLASVQRIVLVGCGTSLNAGMVGKYFIEEAARVPVDIEGAGEYRYRNPIISENTLLVAISQSGETADTLEAVRQASQSGAKVLTITNREDSTLARESEWVLPVRAGVEVSVCATKSFTAQLVVLYLMGIALAETRQTVPAETITQYKEELMRLPALVEAALTKTDEVKEAAKQYSDVHNMLFIARGVNYPVALEGALKLKEISYIHAEGYSGSELKHGPIALLDNTLPVLSILVPGKVFDKMLSNCIEAKARDARMIGVTSTPNDPQLTDVFDTVLSVPHCHEYFSPLLTSIPLQLFSYYIAEHLGKDVDQPRNLAKSVTVE